MREFGSASEFRAWAAAKDQFLTSCDGGDVGSPDARSVWLLGIEPGWSKNDRSKAEVGPRTLTDQQLRYSIDLQLDWPFNRNAFKLMSTLEGGEPKDFKAFAHRARPFEKGCRGYFKGNLFPIPAPSVSDWGDEAIQDTGFNTRMDYQEWLREHRLPVISEWIEQCRPKVLICTGITYLQDFLAVARASDAEKHSFAVNGHSKSVHVSRNGLVPLVVLPHLSGGRNGLNSNAAVVQAAAIIQKSLGLLPHARD